MSLIEKCLISALVVEGLIILLTMLCTYGDPWTVKRQCFAIMNMVVLFIAALAGTVALFGIVWRA